MIFSWFNTSEADQFATDLANEFSRRYPADKITADKDTESRLRGAKDLMLSRTQVFAERTSLNLLKRAKLANSLKWRLREQGYDSQLIDSLVLEVARIVTLIRPGKKTS